MHSMMENYLSLSDEEAEEKSQNQVRKIKPSGKISAHRIEKSG